MLQECNPCIQYMNTHISYVLFIIFEYIYIIYKYEFIHFRDMFHTYGTVRRHVWLQRNSLHGKSSTSFGCWLPNAFWSCFRGRWSDNSKSFGTWTSWKAYTTYIKAGIGWIWMRRFLMHFLGKLPARKQLINTIRPLPLVREQLKVKTTQGNWEPVL